jgi:LCP family protein required for cell wall assembly
VAAPLGAARPRRWPRRLLIGLNVFVAVCVLGTGVGYGYLRFRFGQIHKIKFGDLLKQDDPGQPMNVLLVGSDSRARLTGVEAKQAGKDKVGGERSDTIMILHIDPGAKKAAILSIPRDLLVNIPGVSQRSDRINAAFAIGGASKLIATIDQNLGVKVNHYVEVDFVGFKSIVDAVGGVRLYVPAPARDALSGLDIKSPGCVTLNGQQALAWSRSRHYEYYESGRWREDPRGDLGRIQRQQDFIRRMLNTAVSSGKDNPFQLNRLIGIGIKNVTIDSAMSTKDVFSLAKRFRSLDAASVDMLTLPTTNASVRIGGGLASVLKMQQPDAQEYIDRINGRGASSVGGGSAAASVRPSQVRIRVLNGTGADSLAARVEGDLQGGGFTVADKGDADSFRYTRSVIKYASGALGKAQLLQRYLRGPAQLKEDPTLRTVDVALVAGSDYSGVRSSPSAAPDATTSTIPKPEPTPAARGARAEPAC